MAQPQTRHNMPPEFLDAADEFVQLANQLNDRYPRDFVAAAMSYATARYGAFVWLTREENLEQTEDQAIATAVGEFGKMLRDNLDEIGPVYREAQKKAAQ